MLLVTIVGGKREMIRAAGYAKINLYLEVVGLLPDGYHRLESVMQTLALHDLVTVAPAKGA